MPELCKDCSQRSEFLEFQSRALELDACVNSEQSARIEPGGRAFLGRHYAHSRSILFTLNARPNPSQPFSAGLLRTNRHWEGAAKARYRNWTFSRHLFASMAASAEWVLPTMSQMTDQFIVPWRSLDWVSMEKSPAWPTVRECSAELCRLSLRHHQPTLIFASGKTTLRLLFQFVGESRPKAIERRVPKNKSWTCELYQLDQGAFSGISGLPTSIVRLPHFSRGSYKEFQAVGEWVARTLENNIPKDRAEIPCRQR